MELTFSFFISVLAEFKMEMREAAEAGFKKKTGLHKHTH